jgi:uncharacterized protein
MSAGLPPVDETGVAEAGADESGRIARRTVDGDIIEWLAVPTRARELDLEPHPEGGWYRRTWAAPVAVQTDAGQRAAATLIYFLLPPGEASAWHVVVSDEIWLWHGPDPVTLQFGGTGSAPIEAELHILGSDQTPGARAQVVVPAGTWQRTHPSPGEALVSCLVSPGFTFDDWSLERGADVNPSA